MPNTNKIKRTIKRNLFKLILLTLIVLIILAVAFKKDGQVQSPVQTSSSPSPAHAREIKSANANIQSLLDLEVQKLNGTYNVFIKNLKTNQTYSTNPNEKIPSASIYKLTVMYKAYDAIEKGELQKDLELRPNLKVSEALEAMITISDNESALLLAEKLGWANINNFMAAEGIVGFNLIVKDYPTTTAQATSELLENIYRKKAVSANASEEMLGLLLRQQRNDRIPLNLPTNINVAHKTGELDNFRHDAGIVFGKNSDYIFVFLTETPNPDEAYTNIARLSKLLFEQLEKDKP